MTANITPRFRKNGDAYDVVYDGEVFGTTFLKYGVWVTVHRDGTPGPGAYRRIDAAWALLNS